MLDSITTNTSVTSLLAVYLYTNTTICGTMPAVCFIASIDVNIQPTNQKPCYFNAASSDDIKLTSDGK